MIKNFSITEKQYKSAKRNNWQQKMKKLSKYVSFIADGGYTVMFNLRNSSFIVLGNEEGEYVFSIKDSIEALQGKHPDLFAKMLEKSFVVDADIDEAALIAEEWERADTNPDSFSIIINPTLGCNLRCWYCYENHEHQPLMKTKTCTLLNGLRKL